jgi:Concanavalin A-like lectin/glucanases superfamily/Glycosyl hydrolases family 2
VIRRVGAPLLGYLSLAAALASPAGATSPYTRQAPPLSTPWTRSVSATNPLPDYPRPQLERTRWLSLNGQWQYGQGQPGEAPPFGQNLPQTILVPFPVEAPLSGIGREDERGWYRRTFIVPESWNGQHVRLNFEPVGKQMAGPPHGLYHTASSGIWQTVWLEPVASDHISALQLVPHPARDRLTVSATTSVPGRLLVQAIAGGRVVASATGSPGRPLSLKIPHARLWSPSDPYLYGLRLRLLAGRSTVDDVRSYFGMRAITLGRVGGATRILLNGKFLFETGALDQGYWPDGLYTPPSDAAMRFDILAATRLGYDMLREHQKVQPDRWYYWADRLGILVWQDMPALRVGGQTAAVPDAAERAGYRDELRAIVLQHRSDPSIVGWIPFNEGWDQFDPGGVTREVKSLDSGALVDSDSGSANCCHATQPGNSNINDTHLYFGPFAVSAGRQASIIGEYGGVLPFPPAAHRWPGTLTSLGSPVLAWGVSPVTLFLRAQYRELAQEMRLRGLSGAIFTELAAYEDELGIITYDRRASTMPVRVVHALNASLIAASQTVSDLRPQPAAIPSGTTALWTFSEGRGGLAHDSSGHGHTLSLRGGAGWTHGPLGGALSIASPGQSALASARLINTHRSFTVSAWLSARQAGESGTAVSEPGPDGSNFSLGLDTAPQGHQSLNGLPGATSVPNGTWWTFVVPASSHCTAAQCGVRANMRYDDGRFDPRPGSWHQVTGVYDKSNQTIAVYVDGVPEDVEHVFGIPPARGRLTIGSGQEDYAPSDTFLGAITRVRLYTRALSPGEVWQLYRAERPRR